MEADVLRKLDADLLNLVTGGGIDQSGEVPVFIRAATGELDQVIKTLSGAGGRVRHNLQRFSAVAAWVSIRLAKDLAAKPFVERVELSQEVVIA